MFQRCLVAVFVAACFLRLIAPAYAQDELPQQSASSGAAIGVGTAKVLATTASCSSTPGERTHCRADTSSGVALLQSTGAAACLLGRTWGYDQTSIWVSDGCGGEFMLGQTAAGQPPVPAPPEPRKPSERIETWGEFDPGDGFLVGRSSAGEFSISAYALLRYLNQTPGRQTFTDHLGNERTVDGRNDIFPHRVMIFFKGWLGNPKLVYNLFVWTVNSTDQDALFASMGYQFDRKFSLYAGINGTPGTRSLQGSHPYWLGHDRLMADEFFRPYFAYSVWAQGEVTPGLWYNAVTANNSSSLGVSAAQLDRTWSSGASMWWMPTTHEFGPRGGYGDWERHEKRGDAVRLLQRSEPRGTIHRPGTGDTTNTTIKLADGVNVFEHGRARARCDGGEGRLSNSLVRCRYEVPRDSFCRRRSTRGGSTASQRTDLCRSAPFSIRASTSRARSFQCRRNSRSTPRRRRSTATRMPVSTTAPSTSPA